MAQVPGSELQALNAKYNAAHLAYETATRARSEATASGTETWDQLFRAEWAALRALAEARAKLLAGLARLGTRSPGRRNAPRADPGVRLRRVHFSDKALDLAAQAFRSTAIRYRMDAERQKNSIVRDASLASAEKFERLAERMQRVRTST